ncbi:MAG: gliding motility-associated C-terminal domain-containing protein [Chitinophagaceae bacterium]|nr:gliding motility-associated C-terminal domain-containing protein [Chitinophagaceae bacterium]
MFARTLILIFTFFMCWATALQGQRAYVNTPSGIFELTGGIGSCTNIPLANECLPEPSTILSLAVFKDTIYYNTSLGQLKRFKIGVPGSCELLGQVGACNSMTIDKNGIVYLTDNRLIRFDPYTSQLTNLGTLPFGSAGDLFYFNDKLLLAGVPPGIYEIDVANPAASTLFMNTNNIRFFGLISLPESCNSIKYFGLAPAPGGTDVVELDLLTKTVVGTVCAIGLNVYDAASITETGVNTGIIVTAITPQQPCPPLTTGAVTINAISTVPGDLSFTLDGTITNETGIFNNIAPGSHSLRLHTTTGCTMDTVFNLAPGLNPAIGVVIDNPGNCDNNNGSVSLTGISIYGPLNYTHVNTNRSQGLGEFTGLSSGQQHFRITDAAGCSKDTAVTLTWDSRSFVNNVEIQESHCNLNNGHVKISVDSDVLGVTTSINNGGFTPALQHTGLTAGNYYLQVKSGSQCFYDTTIVVSNINDAKPAITLQATDQRCFVDNGIIQISATGLDNPYAYNVNNVGFSTKQLYNGLPPGNYVIEVRNRFDCQWDSFIVVAAYPRVPIQTAIQVKHPTCRGVTDGTLRVNVNGTEQPFSILVNGRRVSNNSTIDGLTEGDFIIHIENRDQCIVDSVKQSLAIVYEPQCNDVFIPTAFTPNDDGKNDVFRPAVSAFITNIEMSIFNRYGQKIYNGKGPSVAWDGNLEGTRQPPSVYVYMLRYTDYFGKPQMRKGTIVLIR